MYNNKTILITGSTSGIGLGIAEEFAKQNANVMINGFGSEEDIATAIETLEALGSGAVRYFDANMMHENEITEMFEKVEAEFGNVDILVNNAGIQHIDRAESFPTQKWHDIISINLTSAFLTSRLALPKMREKGYGRIINVASVHGLVASIEKSAYVAAKHGIVGLTKTIALENAGSGVTVNSICPGFTLTPLIQKQIDQRAEQTGSEQAAIDLLLSEKQPSKQFVQTEQLGQLAIFLCSEAASQMTGTNIPMDGGWTAQ